MNTGGAHPAAPGLRRIAFTWPDLHDAATWRRAALWLGFVVAYGLLDRMDARLAPGPLQPAPWDLSGGLAFVALVLEGPWLAPLAALAELISARMTPGAHAPLAADVVSALALAFTYGLGAAVLRRRGWTQLARQADLSALVIVATAAAGLRTVTDVLMSTLAGPTGSWSAELITAAVGERLTASVTGVFMVAPLIMSARAAGVGVDRRRMAEAIAQFAVLIGVCLVVTPPSQADTFRYFYLLFLPQIWIALRGGVVRAALGNLVVQAWLILFLLGRPDAAALSFNYQIRLLALAASTLYLAVAVAERRRAEAALRERQDALARVSRLSLAGEMAAGLAHELNQPLMAAVAYASAARKLAGGGGERLDEALEGTVRQSERAAAIVRDLRRFIGRPDSARARVAMDDLTREAVDLVEPHRQRGGARVLRVIDRDLPLVHVNAIQIEQVLVNLLQNALDSVTDTSLGPPIVKLVVRRAADGVEVETRDSGLGVPAELTESLFEPLVSGKERGMGLGLAISRSLVESHGGRLWLAENRPGRCVVRFTLPAAPEARR